MSKHRITTHWQRGERSFDYESYPRDHEWLFGEGRSIPASAAPDFRGSEERLDPEQALVGALSSCHMLTFLALASKKGFVVDQYEDDAVGVMTKNAEGRLAVAEVTLRPQATFAPDATPDAAALDRLHHQAHERCFVANSVKTDVRVEPIG